MESNKYVIILFITILSVYIKENKQDIDNDTN